MAAACPAASDAPPAPALSAAQLEEGRKLYLTACAPCHGAQGKSDAMRPSMPRIGDLSTPELQERLDDPATREVIAKGRDLMPGFAVVLTPEQLEAIVGHVRTLRRKR
jgi:mono/diheme cytochrome c family protein